MSNVLYSVARVSYIVHLGTKLLLMYFIWNTYVPYLGEYVLYLGVYCTKFKLFRGAIGEESSKKLWRPRKDRRGAGAQPASGPPSRMVFWSFL